MLINDERRRILILKMSAGYVVPFRILIVESEFNPVDTLIIKLRLLTLEGHTTILTCTQNITICLRAHNLQKHFKLLVLIYKGNIFASENKHVIFSRIFYIFPTKREHIQFKYKEFKKVLKNEKNNIIIILKTIC